MTEYVRPRTVDEALAALARKPFRILAGGTDVYPASVGGPIRDPILDISGLSALRGIQREPDGGWRIGALTTWADVQRADLPPCFDALKLAAREVGGVQIQTTGTVAGNICNASPAADGVVPLMALDASVEVSGPNGVREEPLDAFITGPRQTTRQPGELVTAVRVPGAETSGVSDFLKLGARHYLVISIAMVAVVLHRDAATGRVCRAGVAVGSCAPVARRLRGLEAAMIDAPPGTDLAALATPERFAALSPIDDVRATGAYRLEAARTLVKRALKACQEVPA